MKLGKLRKRLVWATTLTAGAWLTVWGALHFVPLPATLTHDPAPSVRITDRRGEPLRELPVDEHYARAGATLAEIPAVLRHATLAAEDKRFYSHSGVDLLALARAAASQFGWQRRSGGSTLTEQLIKLAEPRPRTWRAKLCEAVQALRLEQVWDKDRILTAYLNRLDYGNRNVGCVAAAQYYFGKPPADLSAAESAFLAGLPQSPTRLNPHRHFDRAKQRQEWVLGRMERAGWLTPEDTRRAAVEPLVLQATARAFEAGHFTDLLFARRLQTGAGGAGPDGTLRTTLDLDLNRFVAVRLREQLANLREQNVGNAAAVVIDNRRAELLALVGSADYFSARGGQIDGAWRPRSPGSALKPFTYLLAFERGATPADVVADLPTEFPDLGGVYRPENYNHRCYGPMRLRPALANSLNIPAVKVLGTLAGGPAALQRRLRECGLTTLTREPKYYGLGLTLGNAEARLLELTDAYACLARLGEYRPCRLVADRENGAAGRQVCDPRAAYLIADILSDNSARTLAFGAESNLRWDFPVACKTGTSTDFRDNWAIGFTPEFTVGVWVGNFDGSSMRGVSGVTGAGPILHDIFQRLHDNAGTSWFEQPAGVVARQVHAITGRLADAAGPDTVTEKFLAERLPAPSAPADFDAQGRALLPASYASWLAGSENWLGDRAIARPSADDPGAKFAVVSPLPGTVYVLDPDLPPSSRVLDLRVQGCADARWESATLECRRADGGQSAATLREGRHLLRAEDPASGQWRETWITVKAL